MPKFQKHTHHSGTGDRAVSGDISNGQLDPAEIAELFQRLESAAAELIITLGKNPPRKELISRLRRQCAAAATEMKKLAQANRRTPAAAESVTKWAISEEDFITAVRKLIWDCMNMMMETEMMDPVARLQYLRRRISNRARNFECLVVAKVVDRAALVEWIAKASSDGGRQSRSRSALSKKPKVIPMQEDDRRLIAADEKTKRFILGIGKQRIAFDFTTRVTKLPPTTGDQPADVLSFEKKKKPRRRNSVA